MNRKLLVIAILGMVLAGMVSSAYASTTVQVEVVEEPDTSELDSLALRIQGLESALAPTNPLAAVERWAEGVKTRNGALQYALMSPELRREIYQQLEESNWSTGVSSPWIESYSVVEKEQIDDETYVYEIKYTFSDSTNGTFMSSDMIVVKKLADNWFISFQEKSPDIRGEVTEVIKKGETVRIFVENKTDEEGYDKAMIAVTNETKIYKGRTTELLPATALQEGSKVEAIFSGPALMSYPIQVGAGTIRVF